MPRHLKTPALLLAVCLLPLVLLHAQEPAPAPTASKDNPAAKEAAKPAESKEQEQEKDKDKEAKPKDPIERIKEEGLKRSHVMETLSYLTDVIGPRLTGSPGMKRANTWTRDQLATWGLENAHLEAWGKFGRGWSLKRFSAQVVEPQCIPLIAYPKAWSPGTDGLLVAPVVLVEARNEAELAKYKGKLKGAIVLTGPARPVEAHFEALATRLSDHDLLEMADAAEPIRRGFGRPPSQPAATVASSSGGTETPSASASASPSGLASASASASPSGSASASASASPSGSASASASGGTGPSEGSRTAPRGGPRGGGVSDFTRKKLRFLIEEGAALLADPSLMGDGGTLFVASASIPSAESTPLPAQGTPPTPRGTRPAIWDKDAPATVPQMVVSAEHYNRLVRMLKQGESLRMEVGLAVEFHDDDLTACNTIAEIPGTDLKDELVMLGGHMDSWHSGTGATDNAAGVAVAMEAVRLLKTLDLKPRRTIRIALWTGEEEGLLGSRGYVSEHFKKVSRPDGPRGRSSSSSSAAAAARTEATEDRTRDQAGSQAQTAPASEADSAPKPEYAKFSAYFNLDNGGGKIRGVYLQGNEAVRPIFRKWLQPFREMGAGTLTLYNTGGTDHQSFDGVGLPGFQFIQDRIEYGTRTHHSNQDLYDRIQPDDLKQAAVIMAAFVYNTAMLDDKLPRKPAGR